MRIGDGTIARAHQRILDDLGVITRAVVLPDGQKPSATTLDRGLPVVSSVKQAARYAPTFYDVCSPTATHLEAAQTIVAADPGANLLIEKPICRPAEARQMAALASSMRGCLVVNEHYASSRLTELLKLRIEQLGLVPERIVAESTKNRLNDFALGRFRDDSIAVLGYEGAHLIAVVGSLGREYLRADLIDIDLDDVISTDGAVQLAKEGGAYIRYRVGVSCEVELYTSMTGEVGYPCPPYGHTLSVISQADTATRYRLLRVDGRTAEGVLHSLAAFYDPVPGLARHTGALAVFREHRLVEVVGPLVDATMDQHMRNAVEHFLGNAANPYPAELGLRDVSFLDGWFAVDEARDGVAPDVLDGLGSAESSRRREEEARLFRDNYLEQGTSEK